MIRNLVKNLDWDDPHNYSLNKLYTLYRPEMSVTGNLADLGYEGFPDPRFKPEDGNPSNPDFLAIGSDGDAQIIDIKGFNNIEKYLDEREEIEEKIESKIEELEKYRDITPEMVSDYLSMWGRTIEPDHHELVVLIPSDVFQEYDETIENVSNESGIRVWVLDENSVEHLWVASGTHYNSDLHTELKKNGSHGIEVYQGGKDLIRFTRDTDKDIVRFFFVANITAYCAYEGKKTFYFDEIDDVLTEEQKPPMFGHLPPDERENIWIDCMNSMLDRFELVTRRDTVRDSYEWERKRFLSQPRDRFKILEEVGQDLGILEEVP
jgi:hypothetical protein